MTPQRIGGGTMGSGIAQIGAVAALEVTMIDMDETPVLPIRSSFSTDRGLTELDSE